MKKPGIVYLVSVTSRDELIDGRHEIGIACRLEDGRTKVYGLL